MAAKLAETEIPVRPRNPNEPLADDTHCVDCNGQIPAGTPIGQLVLFRRAKRWAHHEPSCADLAQRAPGFTPAARLAPPLPSPTPAVVAPAPPAPSNGHGMAFGPIDAKAEESELAHPGDRLEFEMTWPGDRQFVVAHVRLVRELDPARTVRDETLAMAREIGSLIPQAVADAVAAAREGGA